MVIFHYDNALNVIVNAQLALGQQKMNALVVLLANFYIKLKNLVYASKIAQINILQINNN